jgi:hypothetical protein
LELLEKRFEQQLRLFVSHQPSPELGQHVGVKAKVRQLQAQHIFPVNATAHGISRRPVRQAFRKLQDRDQRESSGRPRVGNRAAKVSSANNGPNRSCTAK